jgi:hypothetical protein
MLCFHAVQNLLSSRLLAKNVKNKIHKTIILPIVLYGRKTWSLTLMEEHEVRVLENRGRRRIFGPKRGEVTGDWRNLPDEKLHNLYSSPDIIREIKLRRMTFTGNVTSMGEMISAYTTLVGKLEVKRLLGGSRRR